MVAFCAPRFVSAAALVVLVGAFPMHAAASGPGSPSSAGAVGNASGLPVSSALPLACLIEPNRVIELGSPVIGTIEETLVERGQRVRKGDIIARLTAGIERSALRLARTKMEADAELAAAQSNLELARRKFERTESLVQQNFLSVQALDQARTEVEIAERTVARAREQRRLSEREWELAQAQLDQRIIRSPIDGVVVEKHLSAGERVDERPIVRLAAVNPLRVEVIVPATHYSKFHVGMSGMVLPDLPQASPREAKVVLIDKLIDSASNTFRVRLLLENKDNSLPAGVRCKVSFAVLDAVSAAATLPTSPTLQSPSVQARGARTETKPLAAR